jgi:hypothetical protein
LTVCAFAFESQSYEHYAAAGHDYILPQDMPKGEEAMSAASYDLVEKYPNDPRAHFFRGLYFLRKNNLTDAEPHLREAIRLDEQRPGVMPPSLLVWNKAALAVDLSARGRNAEAITIGGPLCINPHLPRQLLNVMRYQRICSE